VPNSENDLDKSILELLDELPTPPRVRHSFIPDFLVQGLDDDREKLNKLVSELKSLLEKIDKGSHVMQRRAAFDAMCQCQDLYDIVIEQSIRLAMDAHHSSVVDLKTLRSMFDATTTRLSILTEPVKKAAAKMNVDVPKGYYVADEDVFNDSASELSISSMSLDVSGELAARYRQLKLSMSESESNDSDYEIPDKATITSPRNK